eukprot:TRINITY_DN5662_c0_g2_i1.p1 TRINITY_DN5662_c0_g2~~TRINITY_DN5662_c0_g2_i1.p1  ORF type:complete len:104 (+),score=9.28 TRINITY_DN5662_c0_g2_i1:27-338(+)
MCIRDRSTQSTGEATVLGIMSSVFQYVGLQKKQPQSIFDEMNDQLSMSWQKRIILFIVCLLFGAALCFISTMFLINPRTFAKFYTLGSAFLLGRYMIFHSISL